MLFVDLLILCAVVFLNNMTHTWSSRSRNSGDPEYHRIAALASNAVWFVTQVIIIDAIWHPLTEGNWLQLALVGGCYTIATAEGSVFAMKMLLRFEDGDRRVGYYGSRPTNRRK